MSITKASINLIVFTILMINTSCESTRKTPSLKAQYKHVYLEQFKLTYLRQLLAKSYNKSNAVQEIIRADHSGFTEPILTEEDYRLIDRLTTLDNQHMIADSTEGDRRAEGAQGKRALGYIMGRITSKWLDSLAKQRWKSNGATSTWTE